ncbi:1-acyl-sn-glycerol-3-phosphate acyltransferase [Ottowia testudinis]|uniref:1-acyl-sn-glycerol-3-phosphate acyltransferase n=1 Tax=Ottowia testudinis TaxID=2816950 RepID=A0A975CHW7_9BURK|nr:1-acyl-sn-glycerol-3-phosphate acyltransferase [Ottowia testudinis]QTD46670.1 1-acyl-sn-glycerol-3-phosphate acyltransferase [Ottowia testudinis]
MSSLPAPVAISDYPTPYPLQPRGSALARWLMRCWGWRIVFDGLPARQGVFAVYPHTSNWDFPVGILTKWALGLQLRFWGKDALFKYPLVGRWMRAVGGVPVQRTSARGVVGSTVAAFNQARRDGAMFWLAVAPEGTRKYIPGWRTGFYQVAVQADLPVCLVRFDWRLRQVRAVDFIRLTGDQAADFARMATILAGVQGHTPALASPVAPLDASVPRTEMVVKK